MMYTCLCMTFNILVLYYIVNETMYYISSKTLLIMLGAGVPYYLFLGYRHRTCGRK
jgi:hypothetical protein